MSAKDKARFLSYVDGKVGNVRDQRAAADEYIAHLAEKIDKAELTKAEKSIWQTIVDYIMDALEKVGIKVTDKQIEALIKASYANMVSKASQTADTKDLLEYAQRDVERRAMLRKVYHGTGAEFDKFDHSFMSTGEGNQAFGWGTYVSEVEDVAKSYATTNHEENAEYESAKVKLDEAQKKWDEFGGQMYDKYGVTYTEKLNDEEKAKNKELLDAYNTAKSEMNSHAVARRLYTVEIPDDNGSNYIVYDKDVPKKMKDEVKRRLYNVLIEEDYKGAEKELKRELDNLFAMDMDGNNLYGNVSAYLGGDKNASEFLNSMGFVGIKYPVGSLSGVKSDASNYVIFNEEDAKIEGHIMFRKVSKQIENLFDQAVAGDLTGKPVSIGKLTKAGKEYLEKISGLTLKDDVDFVLNPSDLVHIYNEHYGDNEKDKGNNIPLTKHDIRRMVDVVAFPTKVIYGEGKNGRKSFYFLMDSPGGAYNLLEVYADKKGNLSSKTYYKTKKGVSQRVMNISNSLHSTSVADGATLSDTKVPQMFDNSKLSEEKPLFRKKKDEKLQGMSLTVGEVEDEVKDYVMAMMGEDSDFAIEDVAVIGSRTRDDAREDSDLDVLVQYSGDVREDDAFNILNEEPLYIDGVLVDINPITKGKSGTIDQFIKRNEGFTKTRFRKANRNQVGFVSNAMVAVESVKQDKATPEQWLKMIEKQGGLKAGEDKWLGLSDWLKSLSPNPSPNGEGNSKPRVVTKDEVLEFIGENMIQIEEVKYGEGLPKHAQEKLDELNEEFQALIWEGDEETGSVYTSDWVDYAWSAMVDRYGDDIDGAFEIEGNGTNAELVPMLDYNDEMVDQAKYFLEINDYTSKPINSTRLGYTTEGLENKREIALTVPTIESWNESDEIHFGDAGDGRAVAWVRFGETTVYEESKELKDAKNALEELKEKYDGQLVRNPNMTKEDEKLAKELNKKIRELLLEGEAGDKRVLVIDEIQSKRHQEGREKGYVDKSRMNEIKNLVAKNDERLNEITPSIKTIYNGNKELGLSGAQKQHEEAVSKLPKEQRSEYDKLKEENYSLTEEFTSLQKAGETGIPSAPFEKNWHELAMKRMLRLAAEEGFDKVAWTTGAQQAERYDIGDAVKNIEVNAVTDSETGEVLNDEFDVYTRSNANGGGFIPEATGRMSTEQIMEVFGKDLGGRIVENGRTQKNAVIEGENLRLGGEGMKGFYDKMLPSFVQKYTKKWGAKVGEVTLPNLEESAQKMWSVDVTPQMKESVGEQVMFRFIGKKGAENLDKAEEATTRLDNLNVARQMEDAGKDAKAIKLATGWERGADGLWRYEVEDNITFDRNGNVDFGKLKDYVDAPELFAAYPQLTDAELKFRDDISARGYYDREKNEIGLSQYVPDSDFKDVLVHEIQHAIQYIEGFAEGGNLMTSQPLIKEIVELAGKGAETASLDTIAQAFEEGYIPKERTAEAQRIAEEHGYSDLGKYIRSLNAYGYYRSLGGEVESRNVQKRMGMSLAERRAKLASETEDVAREDQIILKSGLGLNNVQDMNDTNDLVVYAKRDVERREGTRFSKKDAQGNPINSDGTLKLEEVISVEDIKDDDFLSPNRNILLPPLPLIVDEAIQANGKRVVIKKNIFVKNQKHKDLNPEDSRRILQQTLYTPSLYGQNQKRSRPYNWILIHEGNTNSAVLVEVNESKDNIEVVNWHYISGEAIERKKRQAQREGGLILTLESVAANTSSDLSSESKDNKNNSNEQATEGKTIFRKTSAGFDALAYAQQKVKEREDEVRMRKRKAMVRIKDKETEDQKRYNDETSGWFANLLEAWVDFLRPVRKLQESIEKTFGKLADYQNPYLLALTASSRNKIEEELLKVNLIEPMDKFLRGLIRNNNVSYDEIDRYLNAKHGLERNVKLAERDAKNLATDEDGNVDQAVYLNELQNNRKKDYSGLTDLFRTETEKENGTKVSVAELERRANEYIKSFEDRMGQENTETLWAHVKALSTFALQKSYSSNMLSKDEFDELANMYEYYVPLRGFAEKTAGDIWNYLSDNTYGVVNPVKKTAEGRTSRADSIVATLYNMAESAIVQGNKNKTALALLNLAEQSPSSLLSVSRMWYVKNPDTKKWEVSVPDLENCDTQEKVTEAIQKHEEEMRAKEVLELAKRKKGKLEIQYKALPYHVAEHGVRVKRGGQEYIVYVNGNPKAAQALNGLLNEDVWHASKKNLDKFTKYVKWIFRWKAKTYTSLNPEFIITNFQRDLQSAFTIMAVRHGQKFAFDLTKHVFENVPLTSVIGKENKGRAKAVGIYTLYKKFFEGSLDMSNKRERYFHEFMMNGGETGYTQLDSVEDFKKKLENLDENIAKHGAKAAIKAVGDFIEFANRGIENAVRFAAFQTAREHGMSLLNSINEAKEASVNFNRKGSGALLNATARDSYMFINPAIQSTYQYAKLMKDYGWRGVGAFGVWSGLGVAIPLINIYVASMWAGDDDDETTMEDMYMALSPYKRRNFINIYIDNQTYFSVNLPVEQRVPYGLACIAMEMLTGQIDAEQGAWDMAGQVFNNILPRDIYNDNLGNARYSKGMSDFIEGVAKGLTPDLIADIAGPLVWNEDFLGRPITGVNKYNDYLPEWQRIGNNTPEWVRDMAKNVAKFDGNEYDKDWYDSQYLNPGGWYHIITQNVPLLPIISKGYKTYAAMAREDDVDEVVKNIPFGSRFLTTVNKDYAENRAMRYEFELLMSDIDDVDQQNKAINADKSISVMEAAELKEALKNTPEGIAHDVWTKRPKKGKSLRTRYDNIYDEYREARNNNDVKRKRELQAELDEIRKDAIERINEKVNETYGE